VRMVIMTFCERSLGLVELFMATDGWDISAYG